MEINRNQFEVLSSKAMECSNRYADADEVEQIMEELERRGFLSEGIITERGIIVLEQYRVKRAIFIAAGYGSRLKPITINTPKPLVRVHGVRIIDRLIDACLSAGIEDIYIVRGYLAEQIVAI